MIVISVTVVAYNSESRLPELTKKLIVIVLKPQPMLPKRVIILLADYFDLFFFAGVILALFIH